MAVVGEVRVGVRRVGVRESGWWPEEQGGRVRVVDVRAAEDVVVRPCFGAEAKRKGSAAVVVWLGPLAPVVCVNVHLPHDADNVVALTGRVPSQYAHLRAAGMTDALVAARALACQAGAPHALVVVAGDTNVRVDGPAALARIGAAAGDVEHKALNVGPDALGVFRSGAAAAELDFELAALGLVDAGPLTFAATYPLVEAAAAGVRSERAFSRKRMPGWPDRVVLDSVGADAWTARSYTAVDLGCDHAHVVAEGRVATGALEDGYRIGVIAMDSPLYAAEEHVRFKVLLEPVGVASWSQFDAGSIHVVAYREADGACDDESVGRAVVDGVEYDVIGVVLYHFGEQRLMQMAVAHSMQRRGVGSALVTGLERVLQFYAAPGHSTYITLHARAVAVPFYARLGYEVHGDDFEEVGVPHSHMHRTLAP